MHPIIFCFIFVVACLAAIVIYFNRRHVQATRYRHQEPIIGKAASAQRQYSNVPQKPAEDLIEENLDDAFYDPIVGELQKPASAVVQNLKDNKITLTGKAAHPAPQPAPAKIAPPVFHNDLISLLLVASPEHPYAGYELLQALLATGLRYGKMNIFHRYPQSNASLPALFSLTSATEPGIFEMPKMGGFSCKGLILFMRVSNQNDLSASFELMQDTARQLVEDLGGEIRMDNRTPLTEQNLGELRTQIAAYERAAQTNDLFA